MKRWKAGLNIGPRIGHHALNVGAVAQRENAMIQPTFSGWFQCVSRIAGQPDVLEHLRRLDQGRHRPYLVVLARHVPRRRHFREHLDEQGVGPALDDLGFEPREPIGGAQDSLRQVGRRRPPLLSDAGEDRSAVTWPGRRVFSRSTNRKAFRAVWTPSRRYDSHCASS